MIVGSSGEIVRDELHMDNPTGWKATGAVAADVPRVVLGSWTSMNFAHKFQPAQNQEISIFQKCSTCPINCFVFLI